MDSLPLDTKDIPQADDLDKVIRTVEAVSLERDSYQEIAHFLGVVERQGRYYRRAAEELGLISRLGEGWNSSTITELGKELLSANSESTKKILNTQLLKLAPIQGVIAMLVGSDGFATIRELAQALRVWSGTTESMSKRRLVTILSWLKTLEIIQRDGHVVRLLSKPLNLGCLEISDPELPILPKPREIKSFSASVRRLKESRQTIREVAEVSREKRRKDYYEQLRASLVSQLSSHGFYSTSNIFIDLASRMDQQDYLIQVASTEKNFREMITSSVERLYQIRHLQNSPQAKLVMCLEKPVEEDREWIDNYVTKDRQIIVLWDITSEDIKGSSQNFPLIE